MKHYRLEISDYEHQGDLDGAVQYLKSEFPKVSNVEAYEDRDYEAEQDHEDDYGCCYEPIYKGYVEFDAPDDYAKDLKYFSL